MHEHVHAHTEIYKVTDQCIFFLQDTMKRQTQTIQTNRQLTLLTINTHVQSHS